MLQLSVISRYFCLSHVLFWQAKRQCIVYSLLSFSGLSNSAETLEQAWQIALANNHQLKSAYAEIGAAEHKLSSAQGQRLPEVNLGSAYTQFNETPAAKANLGGLSGQFNTAQASSVKAQVLASVPVFTSGRISHSINAAEAGLQAVQQHVFSTELSVKMQVAEAYVMVLRAEGAGRVAHSHVLSLNAHQRDVQNLFELGVVAKNDLLAANVEQANAGQNQLKLTNQLENAKALYNQLLDRQLASAVSLQTQFPRALASNLDALTNTAVSERPELQALAEQISALEQQAQSVQAGSLPQVALNGGYQYQENRYQAFQGLWMVNLGVQWKIFDGSSQHHSAALRQQALALREQREALLSGISLQVRQAWLDSQEAQQRILVTQQAIAQADENLIVTTDRYQQGLATNTEVLQAEELRTKSYDNFNNAGFDATLADLHLRRATGTL